MTDTKPTLTAETTVHATAEDVWKLWTMPSDIIEWNIPAEDWHNVLVEVDLKDEGSFLFRMQSKDGRQGFDYCGKYDKVETNKRIELTTADGRKAINTFISLGDKTMIAETFEPETKTPLNIQKEFCQSVLNNFKKYVENKLK